MLLAILLSFLAQAPAARLETTLATIRGRVTADNGAPLARATVVLIQGPGRETITAITDASGFYEIRDLAPGTYSPSCSKSGYITTYYYRNKTTRWRDSVTLSAAQELKDIDFAMPRAAIISGRIADEDGEPIADTSVTALARKYTNAGWQYLEAKSVRSDDRGFYRLHDLPAGRYYVRALKQNPGGQRLPHYATAMYQNAGRVADAQPVTVAGGAEAGGIDLTLRQASVYEIAGTVKNVRTGQPVANAALSAFPEAFTTGLGADTRTGPDGTFRLKTLLPGRYRLQLTTMDPRGTPLQATRFVELSDTDLAGVVWRAGDGATIRGHLRADGGDLPGRLKISLTSRLSNGQLFAITGQSDGEGNFEIPGVQPGNYELFAFRLPPTSTVSGPDPTRKPFFIRDISVLGQNVVDGLIPVADEANLVEVSATVDFRPGSVAGKILDVDGNPSASTFALLLSTDSKKRKSERYSPFSLSSPDGTFRIAAVIPGDYYLVAWPTDNRFQAMDPDLFLKLEKHLTRVNVSAGLTITKDVSMNADVRVIVDAFLK